MFRKFNLVILLKNTRKTVAAFDARPEGLASSFIPRRRAVALFALFATFSTAAFAVDGVTLINQATVQAAGGFPYVISQSGSYRLSGNLQVSNTTAIKIVAPNVSLDLNGFSITCSQCSGVAGILATGASVAISNGIVSGFGGAATTASGIHLESIGENSVDRIKVFANGSGIVADGGDFTLTNSAASNNSIIGIYSGGSLTATNLNVSGNGVWGIAATTLALTQSTISGNGLSGPIFPFNLAGHGGISAGTGTITANIIINNSGFAILAQTGGGAPIVYGSNSFVGNDINPEPGATVSTNTNACQGTYGPNLC